MKIEKKKDASQQSCLILIGGEAVYDFVAEFREALLPELNECRILIVDMSEVREIDLAFIQLLSSAYKTALIKKIKFTIKGKKRSIAMKRIEDSFLFSSEKKKTGVQNAG